MAVRGRLCCLLTASSSLPAAPTDPAEYEGKCPENKPTYTAPPVCQVDAGKGKFGPSTVFTSQNDFAQMRVHTIDTSPTRDDSALSRS
jgi:hypothetical protein